MPAKQAIDTQEDETKPQLKKKMKKDKKQKLSDNDNNTNGKKKQSKNNRSSWVEGVSTTRLSAYF